MHKIVYVYFSYAGDYEFLCISLASLHIKSLREDDRVVVFSDPVTPFTEQQLQELKKQFPIVDFRTGFGQTTGYGISTVNSEVSAFRSVAEETRPADVGHTMIAKVDSDVVFLSDDYRCHLERSDEAILGEFVRHFGPLVFLQGGAYFIRCEYCRNMRHVDERFMSNIVERMNQHHINNLSDRREGAAGEDVAITCLVTEQLGGSMGEIPQYRLSIKHFIGEKESMLSYRNSLRFHLYHRLVPLLWTEVKERFPFIKRIREWFRSHRGAR